MNWRIFVLNKPKFIDHRGKALEKEWKHSGFGPLKKIRTGQAYELSGDLSREDAVRLAEHLLVDPVTQEAEVCAADEVSSAAGARRPVRQAGTVAGAYRAQVWPRSGVSDPVGDTVQVGARDLRFTGLKAARSGQVYDFAGAPARKIEEFCETHLMNKLVQKVEVNA